MTVGPMVVATFTGGLTWKQRTWVGHLHAGSTSLLTGFTSARIQGLRRWDRELIEVLVPAGTEISHLDGFSFIRTRRHLTVLAGRGVNGHLVRLEPALLLRAPAGIPERAACGLLASAVQQRLVSGEGLLRWLRRLQPLPRARWPVALDRRRVGPAGGRTLVLEVDGAFHMEVEHWAADVARQRRITTATRTVVRATAIELRLEPQSVAADRLGRAVVQNDGHAF